MKKLIAYDLGTGGIKASLFSEDGASLSDVFIQYETYFPQEHFVEQRPMDWCCPFRPQPGGSAS